MRTIKQLIFLLTLFALLFLVACGSEENNEENTSNEETNEEENVEEGETESSEPVTMEDANGEIEIPANPENIIAPFMEDALVALDVTPAAQWAIGESVQDYLQDDLEGVEKIEWNLPVEQVLSYNPDLIIASTLDSMEGQLSDYENIAPTYVFKPEDHADFRTQLTLIGEMLGKKAEAEERLAAYDEKVEAAKEEVSEAVGDETVAIIWVTGDQYFMLEEDRHAARVVYEGLGLAPSALTEELGEAGETWDPISLEKLSELDADHVFLLGEDGSEGLETLNHSSVWQGVNAVENDQVYRYTDASNWTNKGVIAFEKTIDEVLESLVK